jgi:hypothetical protein
MKNQLRQAGKTEQISERKREWRLQINEKKKNQ